MKNILKYLLWFIAFIIGIFILYLLVMTVSDYNPDEQTVLFEDQNAAAVDTSFFSLMSWNIGYCGMDQSIDFFYDGGNTTRVSREKTNQNIQAIKVFLKQQADYHDFILLQEVDVDSKRSYYINQFDTLKKSLPSMNGYIGINYKVAFVPVPLSEPLGKVKSGVATFARYKPWKVIRYQYPGNFPWPKRLFMLDRCFLELRFKLANGKELLVINTHNSAFDDGSLREKQLDYLRKHVMDEYNKGNYVIVGGDWNMQPPAFHAYFNKYVYNDKAPQTIPKSYLPDDWTFVYVSKIPTNRNADQPFDPNKTPTQVIDYFLLSPNITHIQAETIDLGFKYSDHNPVSVLVKLNE